MQSQMYDNAKKDGLKELLKKLYAMMAEDGGDTGDLESKLQEAQDESGMEVDSGAEPDSSMGEEMAESPAEKSSELAGPDLDMEEMKEFMTKRRKPMGGKTVNIMASLQKKAKPEMKLKKYG